MFISGPAGSYRLPVHSGSSLEVAVKIIDFIFAWVLILGAILHGIGSFLGYRSEPVTLLWAVSASALALLIAALNLLRAQRPGDRPVAWMAFAGSVFWAVSAFTFDKLIGNILDARGLIHGIAAMVLAGFSLKAALSAGQSPIEVSSSADAVKADAQ